MRASSKASDRRRQMANSVVLSAISSSERQLLNRVQIAVSRLRARRLRAIGTQKVVLLSQVD